MDVIMFMLTFVCMVVAIFCKRKNFLIFIIAGYSSFILAAIHCLFDIVSRINSNDTAVILDIYPTLKWVYIIVFVIITAMSLVAVAKKK